VRAELLEDTAAWERLAGAWNDAACRAHAFYLTHAWLSCWWRAYGRGALSSVAVWDGERLVALAPFRRSRALWWGVPVRRVENLFNPHATRSDVLLDGRAAGALGLVLDTLDRRPWDVIVLREIPARSPLLAELPALAAGRGHRLRVRHSLDSPYLSIRQTWEDYLATRSRQFRGNLRRNLRKLRDTGREWKVECLAAADGIERALPEVMDLALRSWSGRQGSSIASAPHRSFYEPVIRALGALGSVRLWTLRIGGRLAAFDLYATSGRGLALLKTSYDPALAHLSPGAVLHAQVMEAVFRGGEFDRYDFLGKDDPYKRRWSREVERHVEVFVFNRSARGRLLEALEFRLRPRLGAVKRRLLRRPEPPIVDLGAPGGGST
jgi:CelD/BcsL family acetyltransferase involved in cellulose biosynthesis